MKVINRKRKNCWTMWNCGIFGRLDSILTASEPSDDPPRLIGSLVFFEQIQFVFTHWPTLSVGILLAPEKQPNRERKEKFFYIWPSKKHRRAKNLKLPRKWWSSCGEFFKLCIHISDKVLPVLRQGSHFLPDHVDSIFCWLKLKITGQLFSKRSLL